MGASSPGLPRSRRELDDIVARAVADEAFRLALIEDLERALRDVGYEPGSLPLEELRRRLLGDFLSLWGEVPTG